MSPAKLIQSTLPATRAGKMLGRTHRVGVACTLTAACLATVAPARASAQSAGPVDTTTTSASAAAPGGTTTALSPSATATAPTTSAPTTVAPVAPTTVTPGLSPTTTAAVGSAWTAKVPPPPPPPPPPSAWSAADIALAIELESQIATQSQVLDVLAERYDRAQQALAAATATLTQVRDRIVSAETDRSAAQAAVTGSEAALRHIAVDAYIGARAASPQLNSSLLITAYERGMAHAVTETALGKALTAVKDLEQAQLHLNQRRLELNTAQEQAGTVNEGARQAATQSRADAAAAAQQQTQLLATLSKVSANLGPLVAAAQGTRAQAAFSRLSTQNSSLDFALSSPLTAAPPQAAAAIRLALAQVGKPYVWGGNGPDTFDCSGLMTWAWSHVGVNIPRVAADEQTWASPVPISQLAAGDFVFFGNPAHHVGMYIGNGMMVDAPHSGAYVSVVPIWWDQLAGFGRVHQP